MSWTVVARAVLPTLVAALAATPLQAQERPNGRPHAPQSLRGTDYNITLVTDSAPDFTDVQSYLRSITSQYRTPQEKAIAVWRWSQRLRKQTNYVTEHGVMVLDPILFFTSYGYTNCGIVSGVNNSLWLNLGWKARYVQLADHTVCECSWDGGKTWHMFDNSMSIYCYNDRGEIASVDEIRKHARFYLEKFASECGTNPVKGLDDHQGWRVGTESPVGFQRTLANGVDSYKKINGIFDDHLAVQWGRTYAINLRPHEQHRRFFDPLDAERPSPRYYRPLRPRDNDPSGFHRNIRANGLWRYAPDLRDPATREFVHADSGVSWTKQGVRGPGSLTFKVSAANVVTSAKLSFRATKANVSVSRDAGIHWEPVRAESGEAEILDQVAGVTVYLVKFDLGGPGSLLSALAIETITQLNRPSLPRLVRGPNQVQVRLGPQVETITLAPPLAGGAHKKTAHDEKSVAINPRPYFNVATLCPAAKDEPCFVTWRIETPTPIVDVVYGGNVCVKARGDKVTLLHSWDGKAFTEDFRKADASLPYDLVVNVPVGRAPAGARAVYLRYQFETRGDPGKMGASPGIQSALMTVRHQPRNTAFVPIEITYCWTEHRDTGDVERRHTELVTSPGYQYTINVGGYRDPTMKWVRMNLKGYGPDGDRVKWGYSDDQDVGPGAKSLRARYRWGKNLALGKPYTLQGEQGSANPDGGNDLTDGVIAPPETHISRNWMPTNVLFARDVSPVLTLDLGRTETVTAVRVHAGQSGTDFRLTYPEQIRVETSADGKSFTPAGSVGFRQVYDPPADFVPWERDDSAEFKDLPAGGRLAYAYRILFDKPVPARHVRVTCACRKGWGVLLSEVEVLDKVSVDKDVPPPVVLPSLKGDR